jgi:hypothetical protein
LSHQRLSRITIGLLICIILYLVCRHRQRYQAILWWQKQQSAWRYRVSEGLRDQTLQTLFSVRRQLELMPHPEEFDSTNLPIQEVLTKLQQCQRDLEELSDRLFCPYNTEGLPLAVLELMDEIQETFPKVRLTSQKAQVSGAIVQGDCQFLVTWLRELLYAVLEVENVITVAINFVTQAPNQSIRIDISIECQDESACLKLHSLPGLNYLSRTFNIFTGAQCHMERKANGLSCIVPWPPREPFLIDQTDYQGASS